MLTLSLPLPQRKAPLTCLRLSGTPQQLAPHLTSHPFWNLNFDGLSCFSSDDKAYRYLKKEGYTEIWAFQ